jgi:transposase
MAKSLSIDLRKRVIAAIEGGLSVTARLLTPSIPPRVFLNSRRYCRHKRRRLMECEAMRQEVLIGDERRRRWSDGQKLAIIREVGIKGATVAEIARRHDITRRHIYQWRVELRRKNLLIDDADVAFCPVAAITEGATTSLPARGAAVEILLSNGRRLCCVDGLAEAELVQLIRVVERA